MSESNVRILGPDGKALPASPRIRALSGGSSHWGGPPYDAADITGQHLAAWNPFLWSPDAELNIFRDRIVARVRDMVRNDGWAHGGVTRILDNAIGPTLRPISKPDYRYLAAVTGNSAFDSAWAKEFAKALDAYWRAWAHDTGHWCDAGRTYDWGQINRIAFRHKLIDGDALAIMLWLPTRVGRGRARYNTCVQLIDPDRLSNPQMQFDQHAMRGGVKIDEYGAAVGYWIRRAHMSDWFEASDAVTWDLIPRETPWGRPIVVHDFEGERASQHRGGAGIFTPVLQRLKMLIKYDGVELDSAIINAIFAAYVESPFDHELVTEALGDENFQLNSYQQLRKEFHDDNKMMVGNARIPILFPGEKINTVASSRPISNFSQFENAVLRNVATGIGLSAQQVSNDWSDVNYSSARGALLEAWKTLSRRRQEFAEHFSAPIRSAWLEESFEADDLPLPAGAPAYIDCRSAYSRCNWIGPGMGWIDPVAERQGAVMGMQAALSTLENECSLQGEDFEEVIEQRAYELKLFEQHGIDPPPWAGGNQGVAQPTPGQIDRSGGAKPPKKAGGSRA